MWCKKLILATALCFSLITWGETFSLSQIPNGYPDGRPDAPYGSYSTPYKELRGFSDAVLELERKIYGLSQNSNLDEIERAKQAYYLEHLTVGLLKKLSDQNTQNSFEQESLQTKLRDLYTKIRFHQENLYETMVRKIDVALPGPNGMQLRRKALDALSSLYDCNCRKDSVPTTQEQKDYYAKKLKDFLDGGGNLNELHIMDASYINTIKSYVHLEYVERENGEIWVTEGKAGHVVLAEGRAVKAAGQMVLVKGENNKLSLFVSSNASGSYKPDLLSVKLMVSKLARQNSIDMDIMRTTTGDPMGTQTISVLMKAKGMDSAKIKSEMKVVEAEAKRILNLPENYIELKAPREGCKSALAKASESSPMLRLTYSPK